MTFDLRTFSSVVKVSDGAWGTELQNAGLAAGTPPELWNTLHPHLIQKVADSYVQAGSDVILTNTFGANRFVLAGVRSEGKVAQLAEEGVKISRLAADRSTRPGGVKVFASIGPSGKIVMTEEVPREKLLSAFAEAGEALSWGGADAIVLETFNELDEAMIALEACKKSTDLPVIVSMTFASGPDKTSTIMGNKPTDLARLAKRHGADAVGANCGLGPENYIRVVELLRQATDLPIWVKPNAGLPIVGKDRKTVFPMGPEEFAGFVPAMVKAGANFIGGCCGTTPRHISAVRKAVDSL